MATVPVAVVLGARAPYYSSLIKLYFLVIYRISIGSTIAWGELSAIECDPGNPLADVAVVEWCQSAAERAPHGRPSV
jgi:hypothetical protein